MTEPTLSDFEDDAAIFKATGPPDHWLTTLNTGIWGFTSDNESSWDRLSAGDLILFHSTGSDTHDGNWDSGIVGYGVAGTKRTKEYPLWRSEVEAGENAFPYIVELTATHWRGDIGGISGAEIESKSHEQIHDDIESLLHNRLTLSEIEEETGSRFPVMGSFSSPSDGQQHLRLLQSEPLTTVRYRNRDVESAESVEEPETASQSFDHLRKRDGITLDGDALFDGLYFDSEERRRIRSAVESAVRSGKHVIFTGPPGTGKTELAENTCKALLHNDQYTDYQISTATADWSTFDTVGGYMPRDEAGGSLDFVPGQVLERLPNGDHARNELLVIDEINRADIDKAFGQLFTVLSGQPVQLPFQQAGSEVEILPADRVDWSSQPASHEYVVPESWRLLATMNSYDKTSLYEMSYAFMRRFTFVRVGPPTGDLEQAISKYVELWDIETTEPDEAAVATVWRTMNSHDRAIGPAVVKDMLEMMSAMEPATIEEKTTQAVASYVLPQLEGIPQRKEIVQQLFETRVDESVLRQVASEVLQIPLE